MKTLDVKIIFDHPHPFILGHGGFQIQIEQTKAALEQIGVEIEYLRWWDPKQKGDLIHFFSTASVDYLRQARSVKIPTVMTTLFTATCNRPDWKLKLQGLLSRGILSLPMKGVTNQLRWKAFNECARNVVGLAAEVDVLRMVYNVPAPAISVVPLGLSDTYLSAGPGNRAENHLICTGTITQRKNPLRLAQMARMAEVRVLFVGKPYHPSDPYWKEFEKCIDQKWVKYHPHVDGEKEMAGLLQSARGYVLLSEFENWCLSAHEAAACGLPMLVPDQKWSRERFGSAARYFPSTTSENNAQILRQFYLDCPSLPAPKIQLFSWTEVAQQLKAVYEAVLRTSR